MQEVATVVLRALGYNDNLEGDWPNDYSRKAAEVGLLKYVRYVGPEYIQRGEMASIANEALDCYMVSYVENDVAQGLGYVWGAVDLDGFAPFIDYTNEETGSRNAPWERNDGKTNYTSMLYYAFDAWTDEVLFQDDEAKVFSEASAWGFENFDDGEIEIYSYSDDQEYLDTESLATAYYIWQGHLTDLGGQLATITYIGDYDDDDYEAAFIELTSTTVKADEVEEDGTKIKVDGTKYSVVNEWYTGQIDDNPADYGVVFFNEDGKVYDYKNYIGFEDAGYEVFDEVDDEFVSFISGVDKKISKLDDYKIVKDGAFVEWADLERGDVVYLTKLDDDKTDLYIVLPFATGDLERAYTGADYGVKIDGTRYGAYHSGGDYYSFYSEEDLSHPQDFTPTTELPDEFFTEDAVTYAVAYAYQNFVYVTVDSVVSNYGIVTGYKTDNNWEYGELEALKIYLADKSKVTIEWDCDGDRPVIGSLIKYRLKDDAIVSYEYRGRVGTQFGTQFLADPNGYVSAKVDKDDSEIKFDGETYDLAEDAEIFLIEAVAGAEHRVPIKYYEDYRDFVTIRENNENSEADAMSYVDEYREDEIHAAVVALMNGEDLPQGATDPIYEFDYEVTSATRVSLDTTSNFYDDWDVVVEVRNIALMEYTTQAGVTMDNWAFDGFAYDKVSMTTTSKLLRSGDFEALQIAAAFTSGTRTIDTLYIVNKDNQNIGQVGFVTDIGGYDDGGYYVTINGGEAEFFVKAAALAGIDEGDFIAYFSDEDDEVAGVVLIATENGIADGVGDRGNWFDWTDGTPDAFKVDGNDYYIEIVKFVETRNGNKDIEVDGSLIDEDTFDNYLAEGYAAKMSNGNEIELDDLDENDVILIVYEIGTDNIVYLGLMADNALN